MHPRQVLLSLSYTRAIIIDFHADKKPLLYSSKSSVLRGYGTGSSNGVRSLAHSLSGSHRYSNLFIHVYMYIFMLSS